METDRRYKPLNVLDSKGPTADADSHPKGVLQSHLILQVIGNHRLAGLEGKARRRCQIGAEVVFSLMACSPLVKVK